MDIDELMRQIAGFDCDPGVYRVHVTKASYITGFDVEVEFRSTKPGALSSISTHNDLLIVALEDALNNLTTRFGKCPHCGQYMHD